MRKLLFAVLTFAATALAADVTGSWTGPVSMTNGGETREDTALLILKQDGSAITGTIGPNEERRYNITKGAVDGENINIEATMQGENKIVLRLKFAGEKLTGDLKFEGPEAPPITGKLNLDKKK